MVIKIQKISQKLVANQIGSKKFLFNSIVIQINQEN